MSRLVPEVDENAGISREEVAMLFGFHDADEGMRIFGEAATDIPFSMRSDPETGDAEYRLSDVEMILKDWRGEERAQRRPSRSAGPTQARVQLSDAGPLDAILLADDDGGGSTPAYSVAQVAERCGLEEDELQRRLVLGGAKLEVIDRKMIAAKADVDRLISSGKIPTPEDASKPHKPDPDPLTDPEVDRRTREVAARLGLDIGSEPAAKPQEEPALADGTVQRVSSKARSRTRIGAPRRWGQR